jgi:nitroreductase
VSNQIALEALLSRYSLGGKYLTEPGPTSAEIELIAKAALRAPDHGEITPFRFVIVRGDARKRLANLFESYAKSTGKSAESCEIERDRALNIPISMAVVARIDMSHPIVPAHEQWMCIGGAITNALNAIHMLGYAGKILSGGKVRDKSIVDAFCAPSEVLVGWIVVGTPARLVKEKGSKSVKDCVSYFF